MLDDLVEKVEDEHKASEETEEKDGAEGTEETGELVEASQVLLNSARRETELDSIMCILYIRNR